MRIDGDAGAGGQEDLAAVEVEGLLEHLTEAARDRCGALAALDLGQKDDELVATEPGHHVQAACLGRPGQDVGGAQGALQPFRGLPQHLVAPGVAEGVVDPLEPVQVEGQHGHRALVALGAHQRLLEPLHERAPVGQAGELVEVGEHADPLGRRPALGHVLNGRRDAGDPAILVPPGLELVA